MPPTQPEGGFFVDPLPSYGWARRRGCEADGKIARSAVPPYCRTMPEEADCAAEAALSLGVLCRDGPPESAEKTEPTAHDARSAA